MLRLWFTRRWLGATAVAIVFAVACWFLGAWQWGRHVEQRTKVAAIQHNYTAAPQPLSAAPRGALTPEQQWTRVTFTATYVAGEDLLVRNRTLNQTVGFEVLTPAQTGEGTLLVDRGWVPNATDAETTPPADSPPSGAVTITGWLRTGEPSLDRHLPRPQLASISIADARQAVPTLSDRDVYVVLGSQTPAAPVGPHPVTPLPKPDEDLGPHQAYAYQWWLFMPGGLLFIYFALRREVVARADGAAEVAVPRDPKPKKVRIWDEEDA